MHFTTDLALRELLDLAFFVSGGAGDGLLGLLGLSLAPQSSSHSLLCFFSPASILQRTTKHVRDVFLPAKIILNWHFYRTLNQLFTSPSLFDSDPLPLRLSD